MLAQIPIFIAARGNNEVKFIKNKEALKYSYVFISEMGLLNQTYIISDNKDMIDYAIKLGFIKTIHYPCNTDKEVRYIEYLATYNYGKLNNYWPDWIIVLSIDALFLNKTILLDVIRNIDNKYDVIASYNEITDKSKFFLMDNYKINVQHIMTNEKERHYMIDAHIYAIKSIFARECMQYEDPAEHFWAGKFKFVKNNTLFTDIYDINDIYKYSYVAERINKVNNIKI